MYAATCWGLLGLAVALGLGVLSLPPQYAWLAPWFLKGAVACLFASLICFGWPLLTRAKKIIFSRLSRHRNVWAEREQLELAAIACLSVGKSIDEPYDNEPQLSRHRKLKDAVRSGDLDVLDMQGDKPNVQTIISREALRAFAAATEHADLLSLLRKWDKLNPPKKSPPITISPISSDDQTKKKLFEPGWILHFNSASPKAVKDISFNADGTIGNGRNHNEDRWRIANGALAIIRPNGDIQNIFRYDPHSNMFLCTNDRNARGYKNQTIFKLH
jgi:hypothetical protein